MGRTLARSAGVLFALSWVMSPRSADAQSIDLCAPMAADVERLRTLVQVEATEFESLDLHDLRIELVDCSDVEATVRVSRGESLLDTRVVQLDDAAQSVRLRLIAYVVAEILLARDHSVATPESSEPAAPAAPAVPTDLPTSVPNVSPRSPTATTATTANQLLRIRAYDPALRPWHVSVDAGVRWLAASHTHVGTYRITTVLGHMLLELRHTFGPLLGQPILTERGDERVRFQSVTVGIGFRYRHAFGDDAFFVDGVGAAGFLFLQRFGANDAEFRSMRRFATAGLEARAGVEVGFGRLRGSLAAEFGYARPRNGPKADFDPPPEIRHATGVFLGMTLGLAWETTPGVR